MSKAIETPFRREAVKGLSAKVAMYLFGFVASAYFARVLGPVPLGGYFLLLSVVAFANRVPQGIAGACQKRYSEVDSPDGELLGVVFGTTVAVGTLAAVVAWFGRDALVAYTGVSAAGPLAVGLFVTMSLYVPLMFLLCGEGRFGVKEWVELVRDVTERPLQLAFVTLGFGAVGMALGRIGATLLCLPILLSLLAIRPALPSRETVASVREFARPNVASNVIGKAYTRFDIFLLGFAGATAAVGFYEVALMVTYLSAIISNVVMDGLLSKVSALDSAGRRVEDSVRATLSYVGVVAVPLFVLLVVLGDPIVRTVYGPEFAAAVPFVVGLAFYRIVQVQREVLDSTLKGLDRPDVVFRSTTVAVTVNFLVGIPLLLVHGPIGVVVATILAELLQWWVLHRSLVREGCAVSKLPGPLRTQAASALVMGVVLWAGSAVVPRPYTPSNLAALGLLGSVVYVAGVVLADGTVRRDLASVVRAVRSQFVDVVST